MLLQGLEDGMFDKAVARWLGEAASQKVLLHCGLKNVGEIVSVARGFVAVHSRCTTETIANCSCGSQ
jgi:hypothetical protein